MRRWDDGEAFFSVIMGILFVCIGAAIVWCLG
jgi:hypothetical protein